MIIKGLWIVLAAAAMFAVITAVRSGGHRPAPAPTVTPEGASAEMGPPPSQVRPVTTQARTRVPASTAGAQLMPPGRHRIQLPRTSELDLLAATGPLGAPHMELRNEVLTASSRIFGAARKACVKSGSAPQDSVIKVELEIESDPRQFVIVRASRLVVDRGAPLDDSLMECLSGAIAGQLPYRSTKAGLPHYTGDLASTLSLSPASCNL